MLEFLSDRGFWILFSLYTVCAFCSFFMHETRGLIRNHPAGLLIAVAGGVGVMGSFLWTLFSYGFLASVFVGICAGGPAYWVVRKIFPKRD